MESLFEPVATGELAEFLKGKGESLELEEHYDRNTGEISIRAWLSNATDALYVKLRFSY